MDHYELLSDDGPGRPFLTEPSAARHGSSVTLALARWLDGQDRCCDIIPSAL
jgi:hypothetical protein